MIMEFKATTLGGVNNSISEWLAEQGRLNNHIAINGIETKKINGGWSTSVNFETINEFELIKSSQIIGG
ncbi:hypothetical protein [Fructilactobacillus frigidiflavus]|uniref:hypothetical protein n=1 Tax=Fructilactobacillus frigidiflavus TaxID=3242688 RepID=UPI0037571752